MSNFTHICTKQPHLMHVFTEQQPVVFTCFMPLCVLADRTSCCVHSFHACVSVDRARSCCVHSFHARVCVLTEQDFVPTHFMPVCVLTDNLLYTLISSLCVLTEERLHIVEQTLADVVQQRKQMMHSRKSQPTLGPSASKVSGGRHSESVDSMKEVQQIREQNGDPKSSQHPSIHSIEEDAPKQQQLPKTMSKRGDSMLEGHRLGGCTVQTGAGLPASTSMQPFSSCQPVPVELTHQLGACRCTTSTSKQHMNCCTDMDAGVMAIDGKTSSKTCPSEKSPELGPKLQLARNTAKRRRYTEVSQ